MKPKKSPKKAAPAAPAKQNRGFRVMKPETVRDIASMGGSAIVAGRGTKYMSKLGRKGGKTPKHRKAA